MKNRNFDEVQVGTTVGFDKAPWIAAPTITITQKILDGWDVIAAKEPFKPHLFSSTLWKKYGGYIISQPETKAPEQPAARTDTERLNWLENVPFADVARYDAGWLIAVDRVSLTSDQPTLRAAIDAAMDAEALG